MTVKPEPGEPCSRARSRSIARMEVRAGSRGPPSPAQVRKTVTIVFADLAGSTALGERLDPEALRDLQTRYFAVMRRALERHGGTVEKYIGDAVMAVFGIPVLHEQDALRAVRAAVEMRDAMAELNRELEHDLGVGLELRVGINTGEVAGADGMTDHGFVSGDAVNTAARLQAEAPPGGIVIGAQTRRLVESGVRLRPHGPVSVKGKRRPSASGRSSGWSILRAIHARLGRPTRGAPRRAAHARHALPPGGGSGQVRARDGRRSRRHRQVAAAAGSSPRGSRTKPRSWSAAAFRTARASRTGR